MVGSYSVVPSMASAHSTAKVVSQGFELSKTKRENVKFVYVINLPFRFRVGKYYRKKFELESKNFEIVLSNQIDVPQISSEEDFEKLTHPYDKYWTDAVIVYENPKVDFSKIEQIRKWQLEKDEHLEFSAISDAFIAKDALNRFIVGYFTATKQIFGGGPLSLLSNFDFMHFLRWEIVYIGPEGKIEDDNIEFILNMRMDKELRFVQSITGNIDDLPEDSLDEIGKAIKRQGEFVHLEMAFEAKSKKIAGDQNGALLLAVAALEGAHSALVRIELGPRINHKTDYDLPAEYLRELGITRCIHLTQYLLLEEEERPSQEVIKDCEFGLKTRNAVMHALRNRKGEYLLRIRSHDEMSRAYNGVTKMYEFYVQALEKRLD